MKIGNKAGAQGNAEMAITKLVIEVQTFQNS